MADDDAKTPEPTEDTETTEEDSETGGTFRAVGQAIGGFARRVGAFAATTVGRPIIPEPLKEPLATARALRFEGERDKALARLRATANEHPGEPFVALAMALTHLHDLLEGGRPIKALEELAESIGDDLGRGAPLVVAAGPLLASGDPGRALDLIRRAMPELRRLPEPVESEAIWLTHVMAGLAQLRLGNEERSLRELQKARARTPSEVAGGLRRLILRHGVELALIGGQVLDAESWVREALRESPDDDVLLATLARVMAAKGDSIAAHALLEKLTIAEHARTYVWVGLSVGLPHDAPPGSPFGCCRPSPTAPTAAGFGHSPNSKRRGRSPCPLQAFEKSSRRSSRRRPRLLMARATGTSPSSPTQRSDSTTSTTRWSVPSPVASSPTLQSLRPRSCDCSLRAANSTTVTPSGRTSCPPFRPSFERTPRSAGRGDPTRRVRSVTPTFEARSSPANAS